MFEGARQTNTKKGGFALNFKIIEKLAEAVRGYDISYINFLNNGEVTKEEKKFDSRLKDYSNKESVSRIFDVLEDAARSYSLFYNVDALDMKLLMGLVYKAEDIEDGKIKEGAKALRNVVRIYAGEVSSYFENTKTNEHSSIGPSFQGYVDYDKFVSIMEEENVTYNGPKTFMEFESLILKGEPFELSISVDLKAQLGNSRILK